MFIMVMQSLQKLRSPANRHTLQIDELPRKIHQFNRKNYCICSSAAVLPKRKIMLIVSKTPEKQALRWNSSECNTQIKTEKTHE